MMVVRDAPTSDDRLKRAADRLELFQVEAQYAHLFDTGQGGAWASLFTSDAVFLVDPIGDRPGVEMRGHEALMQRCIEVNTREVGLHFPLSPRIGIDGLAADGLIDFRFHGVELATGNIRESEGFYEVRYRRSEERWLIAVRHEHPVRRETRRRP